MKHKTVLTTIALAMLITLTSYAQKVKFEDSSVVPSASGSVDVTKDKNENYNIVISLLNFPAVERLQTGKSTYVVWLVVANKDEPKNIGQLTSSKNRYAKKSKADFETVSSDKPRKIFITAENDGKTQSPQNEVVITTGNF